MDEIKRLQEERKSSTASDDNSDRILLGAKSHGFDTNIYGNGDDENQYLQSLPTEDEENGDDDEHMHPSTRSRMSTAREILDENLNSNDGNIMAGYREQFGSGLVDTRISNRESEVRRVAYFFLHIQMGELTSPSIVFHS